MENDDSPPLERSSPPVLQQSAPGDVLDQSPELNAAHTSMVIAAEDCSLNDMVSSYKRTRAYSSPPDSPLATALIMRFRKNYTTGLAGPLTFEEATKVAQLEDLFRWQLDLLQSRWLTDANILHGMVLLAFKAERFPELELVKDKVPKSDDTSLYALKYVDRELHLFILVPEVSD